MALLGIMRRLLLGAAVFAPALALAQPPGPPDDDGPPLARRSRGGPGAGQGEGGPRPPGPPIIAALDTNRDGEISPDEIRNAATALKTLDHNHDGILDRSELEPPGSAPDGPPDGPARGRRFGGPPPDGPGGPPDGPPRGGRFGEPSADGPPGDGRGRPGVGNVIPPFVREGLSLTDRQRKQIAELETTVKGKIESILTANQLRQFRALLQRGPGGPGGPGGFDRPGRPEGRGVGGPGGRGPGGPPGGGPQDDDGPPTRPRRPQNE